MAQLCAHHAGDWPLYGLDAFEAASEDSSYPTPSTAKGIVRYPRQLDHYMTMEDGKLVPHDTLEAWKAEQQRDARRPAAAQRRRPLRPGMVLLLLSLVRLRLSELDPVLPPATRKWFFEIL